MGHLTLKKAHHRLQERLDRMPVGAPGRKAIFEILKIVFTPEEAALAAQMPLRFETLEKLARRFEMTADELRPRLEAMADKGLIADFFLGGKMRYTLNPTVVGFFEFTMMRVREDIDQKHLSELIHRYIVDEPAFARQFVEGAPTSLFRTLVHEETLPESYSEILDWERATHLVETAEQHAVGLCHCRHVQHHRGQDCPKIRMEVCMTLGHGADYVTRHGLGRKIDRAEAMDLLHETRDAGLVHMADNVQNKPAFICNCCGCCCEVLGAFKNFRIFEGAFTSNFEAWVDDDKCNACRKCVKACAVEAVHMKEQPHEVEGKKLKYVARVDHDTCLGCGVCALQCEEQAMQMKPRERRQITPESTFARILTMAIEQGKLHELLFDQNDGMPSQVAGALMGAILHLPATQRLLARDALKSRLVGFLLKKANPAEPGSSNGGRPALS